jgi:hypothetical protein
VRRWLSAAGEAADDLLRLHRLGTGKEAPWADAVRQARELNHPIARRDLALRGDDLLSLGLRGPDVGRVLDALLERVLDDPSLNDRERLIALAHEVR